MLSPMICPKIVLFAGAGPRYTGSTSMYSCDSSTAQKVLQDLSHDLRQALGAIEISAYMLNSSLAPDAPNREHVHMIQRQVARAEKNFVRADEIRNQLTAMGIVLEDTKGGIRWRRK